MSSPVLINIVVWKGIRHSAIDPVMGGLLDGEVQGDICWIWICFVNDHFCRMHDVNSGRSILLARGAQTTHEPCWLGTRSGIHDTVFDVGQNVWLPV